MDIKTIVKTRVKTGVVLNLKHREVLIFLKDSFNLFRLKVNKILKETAIFKVNATLCGLFYETVKWEGGS